MANAIAAAYPDRLAAAVGSARHPRGVYLAQSRDRRLPWLCRFLADS